MHITQRAEWLREQVYSAGQFIKSEMKKQFKVEVKAHRKDLVTEIDKATETFLRDKINATFPNEGILGEEGMGTTEENLEGPLWIIDPIDGTANFVLQRNHFAVMVAFFDDGIGQIGMIYDVMADELIEATRGHGILKNGEPFTPRFRDVNLAEGLLAINSGMVLDNAYQLNELVEEAMGLRMYGSAGLEFLAVIKGETIAYVSPHLQPWDIAAGSVIAKEANINLSQINGDAIDYSQANGIILAYPSVYQKIRKQYEIHK